MPIPELKLKRYNGPRRSSPRWTMPRALEELCVDWPERRVNRNKRVERVRRGELKIPYRGFWVRNDNRLDELGYEIRRAYLRRAKAVRTDLEENHDTSVRLNNAYQFCKRMLALRGVII